MNKKLIESGVKLILKGIGENVDREGLRETPKRVAKAWEEICFGYQENPKKVMHKRFAVETYDEMIILEDIPFHSTCEHHLLPFTGLITIGYIPIKKVIGVSKLVRVSEIYTKRLQIQEQLTNQIANAIMQELKPVGVGVVIRAEHFCMKIRGVKTHDSKMTTSKLLGAFKENQSTRAEFLSLVSKR